MTLNLERICKDFGRITSDNADPGGALKLKRICEDFRITSNNVDPGGGELIDGELGKLTKVYTHPFQGDCWLNPPRSTLAEVILTKSLQILSKLTVVGPQGSTLSEVILPKS